MFSFTLKRVIWLGNSRERLKEWPEITKDIAGKELQYVQAAENPIDWRPMPDIGLGVKEIRVHNPSEYRVLYIANYPEAIYVLHVFAKKTKETARRDLKLGRKRYVELQKNRQQKK